MEDVVVGGAEIVAAGRKVFERRWKIAIPAATVAGSCGVEAFLCVTGAGAFCTPATLDISCIAASTLAPTIARSRRCLISAVDNRRLGSQVKQCFAMSLNGSGMFSGNLGSSSSVLSLAGR